MEVSVNPETPVSNEEILEAELLESSCQIRLALRRAVMIPGMPDQGMEINWGMYHALPEEVEGDSAGLWRVLRRLLKDQSVLGFTLPPQGGQSVYLNLAPARNRNGLSLLQGISCLATDLREWTGREPRGDLDDKYELFIEGEEPGRIIWRKPYERKTVDSVVMVIAEALNELLEAEK